MTIHSGHTAIEVRIDREHREVRHRKRQYSGQINFWRDSLPGALSPRLPQSDGDRVSESFAGKLQPLRILDMDDSPRASTRTRIRPSGKSRGWSGMATAWLAADPVKRLRPAATGR